jgi:hypothetical protein
MRLPSSAHADRPWRIHELVPDCRLDDVWATEMAAIKPFRYLIVYPALMRSIERYWHTAASPGSTATPGLET